jgi:hypothetical protein
MNFNSNIFNTNFILSEIYKINSSAQPNNVIKQNYYLDSKHGHSQNPIVDVNQGQNIVNETLISGTNTVTDGLDNIDTIKKESQECVAKDLLKKESGLIDELVTLQILPFQDISFITITNNAYVDITLNCIRSLQKINFCHPLEVFCIGKLCYDKLCMENISSTLLTDEPQSNQLLEYQMWGTHHWCEIFYHKLNVIYKKLLEFKYVCVIDGDIVFKNNNFMNYLSNEIQNFDIMVLNNTSDEKKRFEGCSLGLMFIKSNSKTLELFNPIKNPRLRNMYMWYQSFTKKLYAKCKIKLLPLNLFVNGKYIYQNIICTDPYLYHFNFVKPTQKQELMIKHNMWF